MRVPAPTLTFFSTQWGRPRPHRRARPCLEDAADVDGDIAAMAQFATHIDARRIGANRTPATSNWSARLRWCWRSSSASCTLLFTPSTSHSPSGCAVRTGRPSATASATMSVR